MSDGKVSEWLEEALKYAERRRKNVTGLRLVVRVQPNRVREVQTELRRRGIRVIGTVENFIFIDVKEPAVIEEVARIPGVEYVSYEKKFWPTAYGIDELFKRIAIMSDPLLNKLSQLDLERLDFHFKPAAEIPNPVKALIENVEFMRKAVVNPAVALKYIRWNFPFGPPVLARHDWRLVTYTRELLGVPKDNVLRRTKVGAIDSECVPHPAFRKKYEYILLNEPGTMGHGEWISTCAFGDPCPTRYGNFYPVANARAGYVFVKVFGGFGPCSSYQVMKAMEICAKRGARVVNMSLGGTLTDPIDQDAECKLLDSLTKRYGTIYCVAAGNEDSSFEIGSPGAALKALTVAALDWKEKYKTSSYSSRGWQGAYYKKHKDVFEEHLTKYGDEFLKPDTCVVEGTRIVCNDSIKAVEEVSVGDKVYGVVPEYYAMSKGEVVEVHDNGVKDVYRLKVLGGEIEATEDHKFLCLEIGEEDIAVRPKSHLLKKLKEKITDRKTFAKSIGMSRESLDRILRGGRGVMLSKLKQIAEMCSITLTPDDYEVTMRKTKNTVKPYIRHKYRLVWKPLKDIKLGDYVVMCDDIGDGKGVYKVSEWDEKFAEFLGLYIGDGTVKGNDIQIYIPEGNKAREEAVKVCKELFGDVEVTKRGIRIHSHILPKILELIGVTQPTAERRVPKIIQNRKKLIEPFLRGLILSDGWEQDGYYHVETTSKDLIYDLKALLDSRGIRVGKVYERERERKDFKGVSWTSKVYGIQWPLLERQYNEVPEEAKQLLPRGCRFARVLEIEYAGKKHVYDLTVSKTHNYIANGFIVHNCGIGGDRDSQIVSGCTLWYDGLMDFVPDLFDEMIGTSMSTPHISGLVALALDRGLIPQSVDRIKDILRNTAEGWIYGGEIMQGKSHEQGWGVFHWSRLKGGR